MCARTGVSLENQEQFVQTTDDVFQTGYETRKNFLLKENKQKSEDNDLNDWE
jgi:hypothetical protein